MSPIRFVLRVNKDVLAGMEQVLGDLEAGITLTQKEAPPVALDLAAKEVEHVFEIEGNPQWTALATDTQKERRRLGFGAAHPILIRTGSLLRALTDPASPQHVRRLREYAKRTVGVMGTTDFRYPILQWGTDDDRIPPRWMWPERYTPEETEFLGLTLEGKMLDLLWDNTSQDRHRTLPWLSVEED